MNLEVRVRAFRETPLQKSLQLCTPALIIAPHPDDETLGCGGAIAILRQMNLPVKVAIISDGTKSHPNSRKYPAEALRDLREKESLAALKILGVDAQDIIFFRLPDGNVPNLGEAEFDSTINLFQSYLTRLKPATILLPWRGDPHCDHRASWQLINTAIKKLDISSRLLEYPIWTWERQQTSNLFDSAKTWQLDINRVLDLKKQAITQYRSQISDLIDDRRFSSHTRSAKTFYPSLGNLFRSLMNENKQSLQPSFFEDLYRQNADPWQFETSEYEAEKYATTIAALAKSRYDNAFEIGGSIGVLTAMLADHCDSLLSIDVSETGQQEARKRCQALNNVRFQIMQLPQEYPEEMFDLIILSEVGYYLCWDDLDQAQKLIIDSLQPKGHLLLVHWTLKAASYPLTGDEVHESFLQLPNFKHLKGLRKEKYRLDLLERI